MQNCPNCGHQNRPGIVFCENCGASLVGKRSLDTKALDTSSEQEVSDMGVNPSVLSGVKTQGTANFDRGDGLRLEVEGSPEGVSITPTQETIFGRRDPATGAMPDVDLTPFAGYRMGVSRRHAAIRYGDDNTLDIWDLGSSNGTFLNGQRLSAHRPYRLHDGDEIRLGQMQIRVFYEVAGEQRAAKAEPIVEPFITHKIEPPPEPQISPPPKPEVKPEVAPEVKPEAQTAEPALPIKPPAQPSTGLAPAAYKPQAETEKPAEAAPAPSVSAPAAPPASQDAAEVSASKTEEAAKEEETDVAGSEGSAAPPEPPVAPQTAAPTVQPPEQKPESQINPAPPTPTSDSAQPSGESEKQPDQ